MTDLWSLPDFDGHEAVSFVTDTATGLKAIVAMHSTHLGPAAGGCRFWHYADDAQALTDALRLSRGMSYKNAMAGLPLGGGKAVVLADANRTKAPAMLAAFGRAIDRMGGHYVTAEDVGMSVADMQAIARETRYVAGLPVAAGAVGGDPGPHTSLGVFLGIKAAVRRALGRDSLAGLHIAMQGAGSVASGVARRAAAEGARLTIADVDQAKAAALAAETNGAIGDPATILATEADVVSPNALGAILDDASIAALRAPIVAGGANNQLARPEHGRQLMERGILYAPDYVINAGGIINVSTEYLKDGGPEVVEGRIAGIPDRLEAIWSESAASGRDAGAVADAMAQKLIGRG
ncbi:Glu/Leu/Phe/Val dehydrogenase dimerization domain-containing protein [Sphingomonas astaxanthinifaciens]|uniref:Leucine dehydrogenase n=1 Tax=Sphingomonas astaxanthinifaciens DSM 22298 TaxID=1123267 RepID=A0ABQ5ZAB1_9SPHN|nr:Glu/Leu/Phe/Val dehydrogenase dimerization domain-containing protein [Sphingomonas astaxanthinifaciens]GLR48612.1 leucine dehydrogenase [Sphingomonas astaxanthinifaciens DSM 22298]